MNGKIGILYEDLLDRNQHILIAGMSGSGKSVMLNGIINSILYRDMNAHQMVLIDLKRVEFNKYKDTKHCAYTATTYEEAERCLYTLRHRIIQPRIEEMDKRGINTWDGTVVHLIIDELAELILQDKKIISQLQSICQLGRAVGVQVICATQCPLAEVIPTKIKVNFPIIVGLHTASARHSRNILEVNGCEDLPMFGEALIQYPTTGIKHVDVPMIKREWLDKIIQADKNEEVTWPG